MLGPRLKELRKAAGLTQQQVGDRLGISKNSVSEWENNHGKPEHERLSSIARMYRTTIDYILTGKNEGNVIAIDNAELGPDIRGFVPLITEVQAGIWTEIKELFQMKDASELIPTTRNLSRYAFAVRVVGDSMFQPGNPKSLAEGQIAIVDPDIEVRHRDIVVASLHNAECGTAKGTIKQYIEDGIDRLLSPLNTNYKPIVMTPDMTIAGVVVDAITRFR